jgi:hypothetical protein
MREAKGMKRLEIELERELERSRTALLEERVESP